MGTYHALSCRQCGQYLSFGKKLSRGERKEPQGLYSEEKSGWMGDGEAYQALRNFLLAHEGHALVFVSVFRCFDQALFRIFDQGRAA